MDLQQYHQDIRKKKAELLTQFPDGFCYVMSVYNRDRNSHAGNVCEVSTAIAARNICEATHRLATAEEIKAFSAAQEKQNEFHQAAELKKVQQQFRVTLDAQGMNLPAKPVAK